MENQTPEELPVEMPPEDVQTVNPPPVYEQKTPMLIPIIAVVFIVVVMGLIAVAVLSTGKRTPPNKAQTPSIIPTKAISYKSTDPVPASTSAVPTPMLVAIPHSYLPLILEVSAVGGGAQGERREFIVNLKPEAGDTLSVIKVKEAEITGMPKYSAGATDRGLRVIHGKSYLDIIPVFEGAGTGIAKKLASTAVKSKLNTAKPIRRLELSELPNRAGPAEKGFLYTTQYVEDVKSCADFAAPGTKFPACIMGGLDVEPKDSGPISITCYADMNEAAWCDSIVNSLSITKNTAPSPAAL